MTVRMFQTFVIVLAAVQTASAQRTITLNPVELSGEIVQVGPRGLMVKTANGQNWTVNLGNNAKIKITGTAGADMLTPGAAVRFTATIDKRSCRAQEKVEKITIFSPTAGVAERTMGIELARERAQGEEQPGPADGVAPPGPPMGPRPGPPGPPPRRPGPARGPGPGPAPAPLPRVDDPFGAEPPAANEPGAPGNPKSRGSASKGSEAKVPDVASYEVCAQVVSFHSGRLVVNVQNRFMKSRITAELSKDVQIGLDLDRSGLAAVKKGDKFAVSGFYITPGSCEAMEAEIVLSEVVTSRARRGRPATQPGKADKPGDAEKTPAKPEKEPADAGRRPEKPGAAKPAPEPEPAPTPPVVEPQEKPNPPVKKPGNTPPAKEVEKDVFEK